MTMVTCPECKLEWDLTSKAGIVKCPGNPSHTLIYDGKAKLEIAKQTKKWIPLPVRGSGLGEQLGFQSRGKIDLEKKQPSPSLTTSSPETGDMPRAKDSFELQVKLATTKIDSYKKFLKKYYEYGGDDLKFKTELEDFEKELGVVSQLKGEKDGAARAYDLAERVNKASRKLVPLALKLEKENSGSVVISKIPALNIVPHYKGINKLKSRMGTQDFEINITRRVNEFVKEIEETVKNNGLLSELQHTRLLELVNVIKKEKSAHDEKISELNPGDKLDFQKAESNVCNDLIQAFTKIEKSSVPDDLRYHRDRKRLVDQALANFQSRVTAVKRALESLAVQGERMLLKFREAYEKISSKVDEKSGYDAANKHLDQLVSYIKQGLENFGKSEGLQQKMHEAVTAMGSKAGPGDVEFVKEAVKIRFGIDVFEGDIGRTNVIAFYKVLDSVPLSHTRTNDSLKKIERSRSLSDTSSWYTASDESMTINAVRSSGALKGMGDLLGSAYLKRFNVKSGKTYDAFNWVTLHEIGHAVDDADKFMDRRGGEFGNWKKVPNVSLFMCEQLSKKFPAYSHAFLTAYINTKLDQTAL